MRFYWSYWIILNVSSVRSTTIKKCFIVGTLIGIYVCSIVADVGLSLGGPEALERCPIFRSSCVSIYTTRELHWYSCTYCQRICRKQFSTHSHRYSEHFDLFQYMHLEAQYIKTLIWLCRMVILLLLHLLLSSAAIEHKLCMQVASSNVKV